MVKDVNGQLFDGECCVRKRWAEFIEKLLNGEDAREADNVAVCDGVQRTAGLGARNATDFTMGEVHYTVEVMNAGKHLVWIMVRPSAL